MEHRSTRILHVVTALALAAVGSVFFLTRVTTSFEPQRFKIHKGPAIPAVGGRVTVRFDRRLTSDVWAVITRVTNRSPSDRVFSIHINDETVCEQVVSAGTHRIDCVWVPSATRVSTGYAIDIIGDADGWALETFEIATHHGSTRGHDLIVLPRTSPRFAAPGAASAITVFALLLLVGLLPSSQLGGRSRTGYLIAAGIVSVGAVLVVLAPWATPFRLLISVEWFMLAAAVLAAPPLLTLFRHQVRERPHGWKVALKLAAPVFCVMFGYGALAGHLFIDHFDGNASGFLRLSAKNVERHPILASSTAHTKELIVRDDTGYDAQFAYFMAFDPVLTTFEAKPEVHQQFIDAPSYRYGRIGFTWLTALLSGGAVDRFPVVMLLLVMLGIIATTAGVSWYAGTVGRDVTLGVLVVLIPGFWQSVQVALPEPIAAAFLVAGCVLSLRERWLVAACCFAMSLLVRETGAIVVAGCLVALLGSGQWRRTGAVACISLVPAVAWRAYVGWRLAPAMGAEAFWHSTGDFGLPFAGFFELWAHVASGAYYEGNPAFVVAGIWYPLLLTGGVVLAALFVQRRADVLSLSALAYGVLSVSLTFNKIWEHVGNGQRGTYELFLLLGLSAIGQWAGLSDRMRSAVLVFAAATAGYVFWGAFDATLVREAIGWMVSRVVGTD